MSVGIAGVPTLADRFAGRRHELELVRRAVDGVAGGAGGLVVVAGEPGIGKTRLAEESLGGRRVRASWGRCTDVGAAPAYWPWTQVLRPLLDDRTIEAVGPASSDLRLLLEPVERAVDPEASRFRLFDGVLRALDLVSRTEPLVLVLDDLQWADGPSIRLLQFLAPELRTRRVLAIATYRDTEAGSTERLGEVVEDLLRHGTSVRLAGLARDDIEVLLAGGPADVPASARGVVDAIYERTGGNPFFVRELAALVAGGGSLAGRAGPVPLGVRAVVERRLERLPHATQDLLAWAAVAGRTFEVPVLAAAAGRTGGDVLTELGPAVRAGIVAELDEVRFQFVHDLLREALVGSLGSAECANRNWTLGIVMAAAEAPDAAGTARIAGHLAAGVAVGDPVTACGWAEHAARRATAVLAHEEAAAWYERALAMLRSWGTDGEREMELLLATGAARLDAGQLPAARDAYVAAAELARRRGDPVRLAEAALGLGTGLGGFEVELFDDVQLDLLHEALAALPTDDSTLRALLLARLSVALSFVDTADGRERLATEAIAIARRLGDDATLAYGLAAWCDAFAGPDDVAGRLSAAGEIVDRARAAGIRPLELLGRRLRIVALLEVGRLREVRGEVDAYARIARRIQQPLYTWYVDLWRATLRMAAGDLAGAGGLTEAAERLGARAHSDNCRVLTTVQRWTRLRYEGRYAEGADVVAWLVDDEPEIGAPGSLDVSLLVRDVCSGDLEGARRRAALVASAPLPAKADSEWIPNLAQLAEVATVLGDAALAALVYDALEPYADLFVVEGIGAAVYGPVPHYLSRTAAVLGRTEAAGELAARARELERGAGLALPPPPLWRPPSPAVQPPAAVGGVFRREQRVWAIGFAGTTVRLPDSKGLQDLAVLLARPRQAVHVTELAGTPGGATAPTIDRAAAAAYKARLDDLDAELASAELDHDAARVAKLRGEREFLLDELRTGVGLGGRARRAGDPVERARKAVSARIRDSIGRIAAVHPHLGRHLANAVRTGTWCSYEPEQEVDWSL